MSRDSTQEFIAWVKANDPTAGMSAEEARAYWEERERMLEESEAPILADLRSVGWEAASVWDFVHTRDAYPEALPVFIQHLEKGGYPPAIMDGLARSLGVKPAIVYWDRLRVLYQRAANFEEKSGLAAALSGSADATKFDELVEMLADESLGQSRLFFLSTLVRLDRQRGLREIVKHKDTPILSTEVGRLLKNADKARAAREKRATRSGGE